jgi:serine protease AprX
LVPAAPASPATAAAEPVAVVIRGTDRVPELVEALGGRLTAELPLIDGYAATVPSDLIDTLVESDAVVAVTPDASVRWSTDEAGWDDSSSSLSDSERALIDAAATALDDQYAQLVSLGTGNDKLLEELDKAAGRRSEDIGKAQAEYIERITKVDRETAEDLAKQEGEFADKLQHADEELAKHLSEAKNQGDIDKAHLEYDERVTKAQAEYADKVAHIREDQADGLAEAIKKLRQKLDEITNHYAKDLAEIEQDYLKSTEDSVKKHDQLRKSFDNQLASLVSNGGRALPMALITHETGATAYWAQGFDGSGIDVAVIDSGVAPVEGMTGPGKVINGPDLSFDSQIPQLQHLDMYGHGTHMAGIIGGRDDAAAIDAFAETDQFQGMAPGSRIVNVKVADATGAVDVSQVIAAIDWVVQHRNDDGLNIRVLNLSFGTDSTQSAALDPLAFAVEQAWNHGIVVVVASGNDGQGSPVRNPAKDPFVIAVGAAASDGRTDTDDQVSQFTSCSKDREVDLVAPGRSLVSLRVPGSFLDENHQNAVVDDRFFKGSGTSQASAVVSGAVALLLQQRPYMTPDQVKALLMDTASPAKGPAECKGSGMLDLHKAILTPSISAANSAQNATAGTGTGTIQGARSSVALGGSDHPLVGEIDIFGNVWDPAAWAPSAAAGSAWDDGDWNGTSWSGTSWSGTSWSGTSWSGTSWSGTSWSGTSWSGTSWSDAAWSGTSWSGTSWSGTSWSGTSWSGTDLLSLS